MLSGTRGSRSLPRSRDVVVQAISKESDMYSLVVERAAAQLARKMLHDAFRSRARKSVQTLSTPGGDISEAEILVRRDLGLWAHISDRPDSRGLFLCWFGVGQPSWQATIEINIPVRRTLHCYGQLVGDSRGELHLAHKGGLGGGKFTVAPGPFAALINGFEREPVRDGRDEREYYVLGRFTDPNQLLRQLSTYVHEAQRIRELRRNEQCFRIALRSVGGGFVKGKPVGGDEYKGEIVGGGAYWVRRRVTFERMHAHVQRALARELRERKFSFGDLRQKHGLGPDLYIRNRRGEMTHLFEIKVGYDAQSTFTALGQLLVYSAGENPSPLLVLVTRGLPQSDQFRAVLKSQGIKTLFYTLNEGRVVFRDVDRLLASASGRRTSSRGATG
jgi:hypothetical protein